ncbi:hypothetical protein BK121_16005 [Paenibacillus odorifer]|nr:hypothetical protein BK121_16005 [Paenibacillus odorifer]OMD96693.1 hypothetical protein BSK67_06195 [Paenibacillus odorifer]
MFTEMVAQYLPVLLEKEGDYLFEYKDGIVNLKKQSTYWYVSITRLEEIPFNRGFFLFLQI